MKKSSQKKKSSRSKESKKALGARTIKIVKELHETYPGANCALNHKNPLQLILATILSAQCTDKRVNMVTRDLFKKYKGTNDFADAPRSEIEEVIRSTGFFRAKAKSIQECCQEIRGKHNGNVPRTLEELTKLRGVGRKTANVVLGNAFGIPGLVVDTHVKRISNRLGLTSYQDPVKIEFDLMPIIPEEDWVFFSHAIILHGRGPCKARKPDCARCSISNLCPSAG